MVITFPNRVLTANEQLKAEYGRSLRVAATGAFLLLGLTFLLSPNVIVRPYRLAEEEAITIFEFDPIVPQVSTVSPERVMQVQGPQGEIDMWETDLEIDPMDIRLPEPEDIPFQSRIARPAPLPAFVPNSRAPELVSRPTPRYSELARELGVAGKVSVDVLVDERGQVIDAVIRSGAHRLLNEAALDAARQARFEPAKQGSVEVQVWVTLPYEFRLY